MGRYIKGTVDEELGLGSLAATTLQGTSFDDAVTERTYISSLVATWTMKNFTVVENAGPILVGVCHSDYTDAEIEEVIESTTTWEEADMIGQELAQRKIRRIGIFPGPTLNLATQVLNDGKPIRTKLGWILNTGQTLRVWAYNMGGVALASTTPEIFVQGHVNLWPR